VIPAVAIQVIVVLLAVVFIGTVRKATGEEGNILCPKRDLIIGVTRRK